MDSKLKYLLIARAVSTLLSAQELTPARRILDLTEPEQVEFINRTINLAFPADRADQMTMLIINRSSLTVPLIEVAVEASLKSMTPTKAFVDTATEMIAYAGDEPALRAVSKLVSIDEKRFGSLVNRILDNAGNWRNPFSVAYKGLELGDDAVSRRIADWAESRLVSVRLQKAWAEAMLNRYGAVPGEREWAADPLAIRLKNGISAELRQKLTEFAREARQKR